MADLSNDIKNPSPEILYVYSRLSENARLSSLFRSGSVLPTGIDIASKTLFFRYEAGKDGNLPLTNNLDLNIPVWVQGISFFRHCKVDLAPATTEQMKKVLPQYRPGAANQTIDTSGMSVDTSGQTVDLSAEVFTGSA